jgi:hypothetical protein
MTDLTDLATTRAEADAALMTLLPPRRGTRATADDLAAGVTLLAAFNRQPGLRCGDWLEFPGGQLRRVAMADRDEDGNLFLVQPGYDGCFYHLSPCGVTMGNGTLYRNVPPDAITPTGRARSGDFWFSRGGSGRIWAAGPFRVFTCTATAPEV